MHQIEENNEIIQEYESLTTNFKNEELFLLFKNHPNLTNFKIPIFFKWYRELSKASLKSNMKIYLKFNLIK